MNKTFNTLLDSAIAHFKNTEAVKVVLIEEKQGCKHFGIAFNTVLAFWEGKEYEVSFRYIKSDNKYATPTKLNKLFYIEVNKEGVPTPHWWPSWRVHGRSTSDAIRDYYLAVREVGTKEWTWFQVRDFTDEQRSNFYEVLDSKFKSGFIDYTALAAVGVDKKLASVGNLVETRSLWQKYGKHQANAYYYKRVNAYRQPEYQVKPV